MISNSRLRNKKESNEKEVEVVAVVHDGRTSEDILNDAFLSFDFAMRQSIFMKEGPLQNKTAVVFRDWVTLLKLVLPPVWNIHRALDAIVNNIEKVVENDEEYLLQLMDDHGYKGKGQRWRGCTLDSSHGYTCGLWELFHILTISTVEWNRASISDASVVESSYVADGLYAYISEFFACDVCRRNFMSSYDRCSQNRCHRLGSSTEDEDEWKQLVLWLWEEHNDVNVRLKLERKQKEYPQDKKTTVVLTRDETWNAKWPSRYDCPACWNTVDAYDDSWDEEIMYKYLRLKYWPVRQDATALQYAQDINAANEIRREEEVSVKKEDWDDDDGDILKHEEMNMYIVLGIPSLGIFTLVVMSVLKQMELDRTGRHKKN